MAICVGLDVLCGKMHSEKQSDTAEKSCPDDFSPKSNAYKVAVPTPSKAAHQDIAEKSCD